MAHAHHETRSRVNACRKRLRQTRAAQRSLKLRRDEAVLAAEEILSFDSDEGNFADSAEIFAETEAALPHPSSRFTPEVDRRVRLRAR